VYAAQNGTTRRPLTELTLIIRPEFTQQNNISHLIYSCLENNAIMQNWLDVAKNQKQNQQQ